MTTILMHRAGGPGRTRGGWIGATVLAFGLLATARGATAAVPTPTRAFAPNASFALYVDVAGAGRSAIGQAIGEQLKNLPSQLPNLPGVPAGTSQFPTNLPILKSLENVELAEIVVVGEGDLSGLDSGQVDKDSSLIAVARLSRILENQEEIIGQFLATLEESSAGLSNKVASSRAREGAAELFQLTGEELGAPQIPYPIALAVGPGEQGTVVALGRGDRVLAFLRGESSGDLPAAVSGLLPKRGHAWLYVPIPANVSEQVLSSGAPGLKDNPMAVGMVKAFDQVKEFGLNLNFGVTAMDIEVAFGCRSSQSAKEMADGLQGFLGMMQMAAAQNPATTPQFLSKLQVKSEGASFRLTTAVTVRDLQLAQQQAGGPAGRSSSASRGSGKATVVVDPLTTPGKPPVTLEYLEIMPEQGSHIRRGKFRATNESERAVREIRVTFHYRDARGVQLGEWNRVQRDPYSEVLLPAARERVLEWPLFNLPFATRDVSLTLHEVTFTDGERWTAIR